jgi:hypothetical protein
MDRFCRKLVVIAAAVCAAGNAAAQPKEGGVYVAGNGFGFANAAAQALAANPPGQRFFLLALPPETRALEGSATGRLAGVRERVTASGGVLMVCQRDIDNGKVRAAALVAGVVAVRGWPPAGSTALPPGERYFADENRDVLPASTEGLRRLRTTCSN